MTEKPQVAGLPAVNFNVDEISHHIERWENAKNVIAKGGGRTIIQGRPYINKKGWRLIALAAGLSLEVLGQPQRVEAEDDRGRYYTWIFHVRATAPNGRFAEAWGACSSRDPFFAIKDGNMREAHEVDEANIIHTAQTCAYNRAISDLVGGGEVSAEEIQISFPGEQQPQPATPQQVSFLRRLLIQLGVCDEDADKDENNEKIDKWLIESGFSPLSDLDKTQASQAIKIVKEELKGGDEK